MPARLILASVGAGKTDRVIRELVETIDSRPFARVWVITATKRQEDSFRQRLVDFTKDPRVFFNVEFFDFYGLNTRLLDMAHNPQRELSDQAQHALIRGIIMRDRDNLPYLGAIATRPGLANVVRDFIRELKQEQIYPDRFALAADIHPQGRDLARIYQAYQAQLQEHNLVDIEGQGWLAVETLKDNSQLAENVALLVVDGFDQFTGVQAALIGQLGARIESTLITLTYVPAREATVGQRFTQARQRLQDVIGPSLYVETLRHQPGQRAQDLDELGQRFYTSGPKVKSQGAVRFIETPDLVSETAAVLREVKRLLLDGVSPEKILIVSRNLDEYQPYLMEYRNKYSLPLVLHVGAPLLHNPAIVALLQLLRLQDSDFKRSELLDVLRSPYFRFDHWDEADIHLLEQLSIKYSVIKGRDNWEESLRSAGAQPEDADAEYREEEDLTLAGDFDRLYKKFQQFVALITLPESATLHEYVRRINDFIGMDPLALDEESGETSEEAGTSLHMIAAIRDAVDEDTIVRDVHAMHELKRLLHQLVATRDLLRSLNGDDDPVLAREDFLTEVVDNIRASRLSSSPSRYGRVLATTAANARGLPHEYVFILGLSEGMFPVPRAEDPLYLDSERTELILDGNLVEMGWRFAAEDSVFYELISLARERLTLSRSTVKEGKPWLASRYWTAVASVFSDVNQSHVSMRIPVGSVMSPGQAASVDELAVAAVSELSKPLEQASMHDYGYARWLAQSYPEYWARIDTGRAIEFARMVSQGGRYSGEIITPSLKALVARVLGPDYLWSASQLNMLGQCGFRFFAGRMLKLEALEEPEDGMDVLQRGTLLHEILENAYTRFTQHGVDIVPEEADRMRGYLEEEADRLMQDAPERLGFSRQFWAYEKKSIKRSLYKVIASDFGLGGKTRVIEKKTDVSGRRPVMFEARFGKYGNVVLSLGEGIDPIRLRGSIDRVDQTDKGLIIIDYKSGSTKINLVELNRGRNFQMRVYLAAAEALFGAGGETVLGGTFFHISTGEISEFVSVQDHSESLEKADRYLARYIENVRGAVFNVEPVKLDSGKCYKYCEFHKLCRLSAKRKQ